MMELREITKEELNNTNCLTVGELKKFLNEYKLPDDAKVVIQRIEDVCYEKYGWGVYLKEGEQTRKNDDGDVDKNTMEQYHPAWSCVKYNDENDVLFIDLHY